MQSKLLPALAGLYWIMGIIVGISTFLLVLNVIASGSGIALAGRRSELSPFLSVVLILISGGLNIFILIGSAKAISLLLAVAQETEALRREMAHDRQKRNTTATVSGPVPQTALADQPLPERDDQLKAYKRSIDLEENALVVDAAPGDAAVPFVTLLSQAQAPIDPSSPAETFYCPWCHKAYQASKGNVNLVFRCVTCKKQMLVM